MELTDKQKLDQVLLRIIQVGLIAKVAEITAHIPRHVYQQCAQTWTNSDVNLKASFQFDFPDFGFELINPNRAEIIADPDDYEMITVIQQARVFLPRNLMEMIVAQADFEILPGPMDGLLVKCKLDMLDCLGEVTSSVPIDIISIELIGFDAFRLRNQLGVLAAKLSEAERMLTELVEKVGQLLFIDYQPQWFDEARALVSCAALFGRPELKRQIQLFELDYNAKRLCDAAEKLNQSPPS